jgi:hypothetical protein
MLPPIVVSTHAAVQPEIICCDEMAIVSWSCGRVVLTSGRLSQLTRVGSSRTPWCEILPCPNLALRHHSALNTQERMTGREPLVLLLSFLILT